MKEKQKRKEYWNWARQIMVNNLKAHENEMREAFSHNKPFYVAGKSVIVVACLGFKVKEDAIDFVKDAFCNAGYFPCHYNFDMIEWNEKAGLFIVEITKKSIRGEIE